MPSPKVESNGVGFVMAHVALVHPEGSFSSSHPLAAQLTPEARRWIPADRDAVWVRGRVERLFGVALRPEARGEKAFIGYGFAGHTEGGVVEFECADYYGRTSLTFSSGVARPPPPLCDRVAAAFWGLLLRDPGALEDYADSMLHVGAGVTVHFGVVGGVPFLREG